MKLLENGFLIVDDFGAAIKKKRKRILLITKENKAEIPLKSLREVIISGKVSITSDAISGLVSAGVDLLLTTPSGKPVARVVSTRTGGTALTRREQYRSLEDNRCVEISRQIISGKIRNQASNLRYYSKSRRMTEEIAGALFEGYLKLKELHSKLGHLELSGDNWRELILAIEGEAANVYWQNLADTVLSIYGFRRRDKEGRDLVNILLNVAYNLLAAQIWKHTLKFGLDPYCGFLHVERPGKLALVYDLMEPYRPLVDRFIISFIRHTDPKVRDDVNKLIPILINSFVSEFLNTKLEYKCRTMRIETTMFYYTQELVSYLRGNKARITVPFLPW